MLLTQSAQLVDFNKPIRERTSAILYLFSPRQMHQHYKRPMLFNFSHGYCEGLHDTLLGGVNPSLPADFSPNISKFVKSDHALLSVLPASSGGIPINTNILSSAWTFMLVVNNDEHPFMGALLHSTTNNRTVYIGVCYGEPINPVNHGNLTVNDGAYLVVTHKTVINAVPVISPYGSQTRLDTVSDVDIIPSQNIAQLTDKQLFMNRPGDIRDMSSQDVSTGDLLCTPNEHAIIGNRSTHIPVTGKLNNPAKLSGHIVTAIAQGYETVADAAFNGTLAEANGIWSENGVITDMNIGPIIDGNMYDNTNDKLMGMDVTQPINLGIICRKYNPQIVPVQVPAKTQFDPRPQYYQCPQNVFSSLVASVMPTMLANTGIADFSCQYNSYTGAFQVLNAAGFAPMSTEELQSRVAALFRLIKTDIFSVIRAAVGEFDIQIAASISSDTHVVLNLYDSGMGAGEVYEHNNVLGGFCSQLVGDVDVIQHNSIQLGNVYNAVNQTL